MSNKTIEIGGVKTNPGEFKTYGIPLLELPDGSTTVQATLVLNGKKDGPCLFLQAGEDGTEIIGSRAIAAAMQKLDPENVSGSIIGFPSVYPERLQYNHHGFQLHDEITSAKPGLDGIPGRPDGRQVERSAYIVYGASMKYADMWMNFHADPQLGEIAYPFSQYNPYSPHIKDQETKDKIEKMIEAFGITTIDMRRGTAFGSEEKLEKVPPPERIGDILLSKGVPALGFELHDCRRFGWYDNVKVAVRGIMNVMKAFGMIEGKIEKQTGKNLVILPRLERAGVVNANHAGFVEFAVDNFIKVNKGDTICKIYDIWGDVVETCKIPVDGYVIGWICGFHGNYQVVTTGDYICYLAKEKEGQGV